MKIGVLDIQGSVEEHFKALKKAGVMPVLVKNKENLSGIKGLIIPGGESTTIGKLLNWYGLKNEIVERASNGMPVWGTCAGAILLAKRLTDRNRKGLSGGNEDDSSGCKPRSSSFAVNTLGLMDISVERNAYGRQLDSFEAEIEFDFRNEASEKAPSAALRENFSKASNKRYFEKKEGRGKATGSSALNQKLPDGRNQKLIAVFIRAPKILKTGKNVEVLAKYERIIVAAREKNLLATTFHPELTDDLRVHRYFAKMCGPSRPEALAI